MYFSKLNNPKQLRKQILLGAKESLLILSKQKELEDLKMIKDKKIKELLQTIQMINKQIKMFDSKLPNKELKKEPLKRKPHNPIHHHRHKTEEKILPPKKSSANFTQTKTSPKIINHKNTKNKYEFQTQKQPTITDMDRLEYTLKKIEDKLASLE